MQVSNHVTVVYTGLDLVTVEVPRRLLSRVCSAVLTPASGCSRRTKKTAITQTHQCTKLASESFGGVTWRRTAWTGRQGERRQRTFAQPQLTRMTREKRSHRREAVTQYSRERREMQGNQAQPRCNQCSWGLRGVPASLEEGPWGHGKDFKLQPMTRHSGSDWAAQRLGPRGRRTGAWSRKRIDAGHWSLVCSLTFSSLHSTQLLWRTQPKHLPHGGLPATRSSCAC